MDARPASLGGRGGRGEGINEWGAGRGRGRIDGGGQGRVGKLGGGERVGAVLHGESSKRLATPRNTKDKKHHRHHPPQRGHTAVGAVSLVGLGGWT